MDKMDLVRVTLENKEQSVNDAVAHFVSEIEQFGAYITSKSEQFQNSTLLDYAASKLESYLHDVRRLQSDEAAARELRKAYTFLTKEDQK